MHSAHSPSHQKTVMEYPFTEAPQAGTVREIAPGIYWVRMPLPFALEHINLWLLADHKGWTIVDCGYATSIARAAWEQIFAQHLEYRPVTRLIVTHSHPDHIGLCHWLSEKFALTPWITKSEYLLAHAYYHRIGGTGYAALAALHERHGLARDRLVAAGWREDHYRRGVPQLPDAFRSIGHGEAIEIGGNNWRVIVGHGHSPEHAAFYCKKLGVLIAGDMLLPRISTNVAVWPTEPEGDPASLEQFRALDAGTLVLPSHGMPFRGMASRIDELGRHHQTRLARLIEVCEQPVTAAELLPHLFKRKFDDYQLVFAMGEAIAHLNYLMHRGALKRIPDRDGMHRFVRRAAVAGT